MADWLRIAGYTATGAIAAAVVITAVAAEYQRQEQFYGETENRASVYGGNYDLQARGHQNHMGLTNLNTRDDELTEERRRRLIELRENRIREMEEERRRQREEEEERKRQREDEEERKRQREEEKRKKTAELKSMLDSFDDAFDAETGVTTERGYIEEDFNDLSRHVEKQRSKRAFKSKQLAQHGRSQNQER